MRRVDIIQDLRDHGLWTGDAVMGMVVTQLVFASTLSGDCETLHNRRKVMVRQAGA